jgi:2-oxoglutarate ferredoxin oxidoreductase subunit beta
MRLADGAGATYAARASVYHVPQLKNYIQAGLRNKGFSLVEAVSTCPTYFGRRNKRGDAAEMVLWLKDNCPIKKPGAENPDSPYLIGEFVKKEAPEYTASYKKVIEKAGGVK